MPADYRALLDTIVKLWNTGDVETARQLYSDQAERHDPIHAEPGRGPREIARSVAEVRTAFPDFTLEITDHVAQGDRFVIQWTCSGTHKGEFLGIPATGKRISITGLSLNRLEMGKLVEEHVAFDRLSMLEQMGILPGPAMNKAKQAEE